MSTTPFSVQRRVGWGECDPALIYYAPHAIDYAVETLESWLEDGLGVSWLGFADRYGLDALFLRIDCRYLKPLAASQMADLRVSVSDVGLSSFVIAVSGESSDGQHCFMVRLVVGFVSLKERSPVPIPLPFKVSLEACWQQDAINRDAGRMFDWADFPVADRAGKRTMPSWLTVPAPQVPEGSFLGARRVVCGECDASGGIYAPKVFVYAVEAVGEWFEAVLGVSWMELVWERFQGAPFVSASCQYLLPSLPGDRLAIIVDVTKMGRCSLEFNVSGYNSEGGLCFYAVLTSCFVDRQGGFKAISIPDEFREKIRLRPIDCDVVTGSVVE